MFSSLSFSNMSSSISEIFESDSLKMILKNIPTSRTNFYFESKTLNGFKENLHEEIQDILIELEASEENLRKTIKIFIIYIEKHEKILREKDEFLFNLTSENEKLIMKLSFGSHHDPLIHENLILMEKNEHLTEEIEILDIQCQKYEKIINELKNKYSNNSSKNEGIIDLNKEFLKNYEYLKNEFPAYFCLCQGNYEEIKQQNASLRDKLSEKKQENIDLSQNIQFLHQKLEKFEKNEQRILNENQRLKGEITKINNDHNKFFTNFEEFSLQKKPIILIRMRSLSMERAETKDSIDVSPDIQNKYCRSPLLRKKKNNLMNLLDMRENVRRKTRAFSRKYSNLWSDIQRSLQGNDGAMDNIFDEFEGKDEKKMDLIEESGLGEEISGKNFESMQVILNDFQERFETLKNFDENPRINHEESQVENLGENQRVIRLRNSLKKKNIESRRSLLEIQVDQRNSRKKVNYLNSEKAIAKDERKQKLKNLTNFSKTKKFMKNLNKKELLSPMKLKHAISEHFLCIREEKSTDIFENQEKIESKSSNVSSCKFKSKTIEDLTEFEFFSKKKQMKKYSKVNYMDLLIFSYLLMINLMKKTVFWTIENQGKNSKSLIRKSLEKSVGLGVGTLRNCMVIMGFLLGFQLSLLQKISNKIKIL